MLTDNKLQEIHETTTAATATVESPNPIGLPAANVPGTSRPARRSWRWVSALAATGAVLGIVTIAAVNQPDRDLASGSVSDGSFEVAEVSRMETLRDLASAP